MLRTLLLVLAVLGLGVVLVVSRSGEDATTVAAESGRIEISMGEYRFEPEEVVLPTEQPLELTFVNDDDNAHHVSFGRSPVTGGSRACFDEDLLEGLDPVVVPTLAHVSGQDGTEPFEILVEPQQSVEVRVELPADRAGDWEMGCFTARGAHFRAGLVGTVHVGEAD